MPADLHGLACLAGSAGLAGLAALRAAPGRAVVALDYDGTLAPVVDRPELAVPEPGVVEALRALAPRVGTLALVTGRPADVVVELAGLAVVPGLVVLGQYGTQRWDGVLTSEAPAPGLAVVRAALPPLLGPLRLEDKGLSLVVHARGLPGAQGALDALAPRLRTLAAAAGLEVHPGKLVLEVRPPGSDKRSALLSLCVPPPAAVLFAGDDVGDLPAFEAVAHLRALGTPGLAVLSDSPDAPAVLRAAADVVVDGPRGVLALLRELL